MFQKINDLISNLWVEKDKNKARDNALHLANQLLLLMGAPEKNIKSLKDIYNAALPTSYFNNQKVESWFENHPYFNGPIALKLYDDKNSAFESSFFHLSETATKARIAATTLLGVNWEDLEIYELPKYKVGIDFFLNYESNSLLMVVSKRGNVRVIEFSERLTHTQVGILENLSKSKGVLAFDGIDTKTGQILPREPQKTIHEMLWKELQVNEVNKNFYSGIADHFEKLSHFIHLSKQVLDSKDAQFFSSRLIGRILFIWFLKKMNYLNPEIKYFELENFSSTDYYEKKLKPLFFEVLNTPVEVRKYNDFKTPFLNGGLFEANSNDFSSTKLIFPENYFHELYNHLNSFNFTVDESTPEYEQVAIDPEMLGRVFENLLASIVPETASMANERKNKGAFYTPREIVSYMCKESLSEYLKTKINDESLNIGINKLIYLNDAKFIELKSSGLANLWGVRSKEIMPKLIDLINEVKVFDPACGSGAFPIGMLQLISRTFDRLNAKFDITSNKHIPVAGKPTYDHYHSKLFIISNNLYGSDIEPMAIEIARLRCWLSLIVEEENEVHPLPNLDFNFVCSNTLLKLDEEISLDLGGNEIFENKFSILRNTYFNTHQKTEKNNLRNEFHKLFNSYQTNSFTSKRVEQLKSWDPFNVHKPSKFFDAKLMFNVEYFDVVIANPPYIQLQKNKGELAKLYQESNFYSYEKTGDIYILFFELALNLLKSNGILNFITSNKWLRVAYGTKLRNLMINKYQPVKIIDLGSNIFESATVDTNISIIRKQKYIIQTQVSTLDSVSKENINLENLQFYNIFFRQDEPWSLISNIDQQIKIKLNKFGIAIKNNPDIEINRGILTGLNDAFVLDEKTKNYILKSEKNTKIKELIFPLVGGRNIKRFALDYKNEYLLNIHNGLKSKNISKINIHEFPIVKKHLDKFYSQLDNRQDKGDTPYNLRNCAYLDKISQPKIIFGEIVQSPSFYFDKDGIYSALASAYLLTGKNLKYYVSLLNSDIMFYFFKEYYSGGGLGDKGVRYKKEFFENLPLPKPSANQVQEIETLYDRFLLGKVNLSQLQLKVSELIFSNFKFTNEEIEFIKSKVLAIIN